MYQKTVTTMDNTFDVHIPRPLAQYMVRGAA